jgi:DUF1680 family protein
MTRALTPVPFTDVDGIADFWANPVRLPETKLVPRGLLRTAVAVENLRRTGAKLRGEDVELLLSVPIRHCASEVFKVIEGAAYVLRRRRDARLEADVDELVDVIAAAQQPDGYLYEPHIVGVPADAEERRLGLLGPGPYTAGDLSHETYNMGHLYEAAVAYRDATGKRALLDVAEKNARHIERAFFLGDPAYNDGIPIERAPDHQEMELALLKLASATGEDRYRRMAKRFLEIRGVTFVPSGAGLADPQVGQHPSLADVIAHIQAPEFAQQHAPVAEQTTAVGHAVRALYQYIAMADIAALTDEQEYLPVLTRIWDDMAGRKMYLTGGVGVAHRIESFGAPFELPNAGSYSETCAAIANVLLGIRLAVLTRDAAFADVAEIALYNNVLAGTSLDGETFFYVNPLESDGSHPFNHGSAARSPWFSTACCPTNLARFLPQLPGLFYAHGDDDLYVLLYATNTTEVALAGGRVRVTQQTRYPYEGGVRIAVEPAESDASRRFAVHLRIPSWTGGRFLPSGPYDFDGEPGTEWQVRVNGRVLEVPVSSGFAMVEREWSAGDVVELVLPMPVRRNSCVPEVTSNRGRRAFTRGPLVLCAEDVDNPPSVFELELARDLSAFTVDSTAIGELDVPRVRIHTADDRSADLTLIPYFAWGNRGAGAMSVWLPVADDPAEGPNS